MKKACIIFSSQTIFCYQFPFTYIKRKIITSIKKNPLLRQNNIFLLFSRFFFNFDPDCKKLIKKTFSTLLPLCPLDTPMVLIILMIALMTSLLASAQTSVALVILVFSICKKKLELLNLFNIILAFLQEYDAVVLGGRIWVRKGSFSKNWTYFSKVLSIIFLSYQY